MAVVKKAKRIDLWKYGMISHVTCCKEIICNQDWKVFIKFETAEVTNDLVNTI